MASAESYVGSVISLITKSEIRYEGVLYKINTDESSIGLENVRSFGSEGRKENGQQIPAGDIVYDYILFRGSDIKDLQVKFTPPAQPTPMYNDPAIIQSHYPHLASASTTLPPVGSGSVADLSSNTAQYGLQSSAVQSNLPFRQPVGNLGSWGPAPSPPSANGSGLPMPWGPAPSPPSANGSGLPMPMYWPGYYAPSGGHPHLLQPSFLQPPLGLPNPHSALQPLKYPGINLPVLSGSQNLPQFTDPLLPPVSNTRTSFSTPLQYASTSAEVGTFAPQASEDPMLDKLPRSSHPASSLGVNLPSVRTSASTSDFVVHMSQSMTSVTSSSQRTIPAPTMTYQSVSRPIPSVVGSSSGSQVETSVALITPDQLLQRGPLLHSPQSLKTSTSLMNGEKISTETSSRTTLPDSSVSFSEKAKELLLPLPKSTNTKEPILPLPKPTGQKKNAASYIYHHNVGPGRGRGNMIDGASPTHPQNVGLGRGRGNETNGASHMQPHNRGPGRGRGNETNGASHMQPHTRGPGRGRGNETNGASHMQPHNRGPGRGRGNEISGASHMPPHNWHPGRGRGNIGNMANGASQMYQHNRGPGRGTVNEQFRAVARPVTRFTEEFDFSAMNEKFKKDEVWGHLGNSKAQSTNREGEAKDVSNGEVKTPVYRKDDFFDSLSSGKHDYEQSGRRSRLSDQLKLDTETFGVLQRRSVGQNGAGYRGSSRGRGIYYSGRGQGRGYSGRGQGRGYMWYEEL